MSDNFELLRTGYEAINRGDVEALLAVMQPDVEWIPLRAPIEGSYHGHEGIREFMRQTAETFDEFRVVPGKLSEPRPDCVLAIGTIHGRVGSTSAFDQPAYAVNWIRDGLLDKHEAYTTEAEALAAVERGR